MTPEQIKDARDWLDTLTGYTPGPWVAGGDPMDRAVWSSPSDRVCFMAHSLGQDDERHFATARLIAAGPDLRDRYTAALDEIERLRAALSDAADALDNASRDIGNAVEALGDEGPSREEARAFLAAETARAALKGDNQ